MTILAAIAVTALLAALVFIWQQDRRHTREARRLEADLAAERTRVQDLNDRLMYALDRPWQVPEALAEETVTLPPVFEDFGPEMVEAFADGDLNG